MKKFNRILALVFSALFTLSCFAGCKKNKEESSSESQSESVKESQSESVFTPPVESESSYEKSGHTIINNGVSEYVIVVPAEPKANEYTAAEELQYFIKLSTKATMQIVTEAEYSVKQDSAVICIGDTAFADQKGVKTDGGLDSSGYVMKTVGNQLFIRSDGDGLGCVYAVYDLLESSIGYRYYYTDEIYYEEKSTVELYKYDLVVDPDYDFRAMSTWNAFLYSNPTYMRRMRTNKMNEGWAWSGEMHQQLREGGVIPKSSEGYNKHRYGTTKTVDGVEVPDHWVSETGDQLCWTAGEEMYEQAAKDIFERIKSEPTKVYFGVGQADTTLYCSCERCKAAMADWALNDAGLQIHFINRVSSYVNEWVERDFPGREIRLVIFAYYSTETPPVKKDENGKWVPYSDKVTLTADNVDIYFAPIYTDYSKPLTAVENQDEYNNLVMWSDYLEGRENQFLLYTYDTNFHYFFYNFNNFDTFASQIRTYSEFGVDYVHSQGANNTNQPCFQEMRYFVESQILWDNSKNYDELVNEFMGAFYKDAASEIREYYDLIRMRYEQATVLNGKQFTSIYANIGDKTIWTEGVVDAIDDIFERAYQKIEHYQFNNPAMYVKLRDRIKELELTNTYTKLSYYSSNYTQSEINALVDEFSYYVLKFDINMVKENGNSTTGLFDYLKK